MSHFTFFHIYVVFILKILTFCILKDLHFYVLRISQILGSTSRVRVGKGSDREGHQSIWAGAVRPKTTKIYKKTRSLLIRPTSRASAFPENFSRPTDKLTDRLKFS